MTNNGENVDDNIIWSNLLTSGTKGIIKNMVNNTPATTSLIKKKNKSETFINDMDSI